MLTRVLSTVRRLKRLLTGQALILLYHRITDVPFDPWSLSVTPQHFADHLEILNRRASPTTLTSLITGLETGTFPSRPVVVTFDDGYADNVLAAKPLLERFDVPALFFITTGYIGDRVEFWWDRLERALFEPPCLPHWLHLNVDGKAMEWQFENDGDARRQLLPSMWRAWDTPQTARHHLYQVLWELLHPLEASERDDVLMELVRWSGIEPAARETHRRLSTSELRSLAHSRIIEVGAHSRTHSRLSGLPPSLQREEIVGSKEDLERRLDQPIMAFSYPYGKAEDYTPTTASIVKEAGFRAACSNIPGQVSRGTDVFALPRVHVHDWDGETFSRQLSAWFDS